MSGAIIVPTNCCCCRGGPCGEPARRSSSRARCTEGATGAAFPEIKEAEEGSGAALSQGAASSED
jgi:hypothetical protein